MQRSAETPSDTSTEFQDSDETSSYEEYEDSMADSEELERSERRSKRPGRKTPHENEPQEIAKEAGDMPEELLKGIEQGPEVHLDTPLTREEEPKKPEVVMPQDALHGGRIMLPLSPFLKPKIHFPVSPLTATDGTVRGDLHEKIQNWQYINTGLANTIKYQMYLKNLLIMNKMASADRRAGHPQQKRAAKKDAEESEEEEPAAKPKRRVSLAALKRSKREDDASQEEEELEEREEEEKIEKVLSYREEDDSFYVKFRGKSYLHCEWVSRAEATETKTAEMRVRRFFKTPPPAHESGELFDPELIEVEKVIAEEEEVIEEKLVRKIYLIKWRKFPYESSTFEYYDHVCDCEGFEEAHGEFVKRRERAYVPITSLSWRPSRDRIPEVLVFKGGRKLREYQKEGVSWLLNKWLFRQSCILADEMGLGKTVQSVTFVDTVISRAGQKRPALVVAPLTTIAQWEREFAAWTDLRVLIYHGTQAAREIMSDFEFRKPNGALLFDVVLTTYEMVIAGVEHLSVVPFGVSVLDEAHRLKNSKSMAIQALRGIEIDHKVLLSGTPLQNNLGELWSLLNFIDPEKFVSLKQFLGAHKMEQAADVEKIQALLKPVMLRRMKDDVESIPVKEETIVEIELTMIQKRFYRAILEKNIEFLGAAGSTMTNLRNIMMELRKCCIHPYLVEGAEEQILIENGKEKELENNDKDEYFKLMIQSSGKLVFLDKLLAKLHGGHKVLVFSQMTRCLDLIADFLQYKGYLYERIDGTVRGDVRQASIDRFSEDKEIFVFLLCTRAGGVGINLTAADTVIIFDSDWNPQNDLQAQARCHRIGQTSEVKIYRLVTRNTYEREMFDRASMKLGLDRAILHKEKDKESALHKKGRVESLLKKGAYGVLMEEDEVNQQFCDEDIDAILEGRTKVVRHEDQSGNVFSKASFQVAEEIDDPDFWDNLLVKRRAADAENRLRRVLRKMAKQGVFTPEEEKERLAAIAEAGGEQARADLTVELRGTKGDAAGFFPTREQSARSIRKALSKIKEDSVREDMTMGLEWAVQYGGRSAAVEDTEELDARIDPLRLLYRCQVSELLAVYDSARGAVEIDWKQWSVEDDDLIVEQTRRYGLGLYRIEVDEKQRVGLLKSEKGKELAVYRGKTREELNQRVKKIIATINKKEEAEKESVSVSAAIEMFGRTTPQNRESIVKMFKGRNIITEMTNMVNAIEENMRKRQSRRSGFDAELAKVLSTRILLFDKLQTLSRGDVPSARKTPGLPRGWDKERDKELVRALLSTGLTKETFEALAISEDAVIKRAEALVRNVTTKQEDTEVERKR